MELTTAELRQKRSTQHPNRCTMSTKPCRLSVQCSPSQLHLEMSTVSTSLATWCCPPTC